MPVGTCKSPIGGMAPPLLGQFSIEQKLMGRPHSRSVATGSAAYGVDLQGYWVQVCV